MSNNTCELCLQVFSQKYQYENHVRFSCPGKIKEKKESIMSKIGRYWDSCIHEIGISYYQSNSTLFTKTHTDTSFIYFPT